MVGMVIVSHSRQLAEAACRLAKGVGKDELPIAFAGGAGEDHTDLGTDATDIMEAMNAVNAGDGVLVLMDLGSAVLSARLAAQMLEDEIPNIRLCPAPLVEGAVAAAVQIGAGAGIDAVFAEAKNALAAKTAEMAQDDGGEPAAETTTPAASEQPPPAVPADAVRYRFAIDDPNGMHTRPAAELVKALTGFKSEVRIRNFLDESPFVNARSLNQIALSNIRRGDVAELAIWGEQAQETLAAVKKLVNEVYHGHEALAIAKTTRIRPREDEEKPGGGLVQLSPGVALGILFVAGQAQTELLPTKIADPDQETARLDAAVAQVRQTMETQKAGFAGGGAEAAILEAQLLILDDAEVLNEVKEVIRRDHVDAASAYQKRMLALADGYRSLSTAYMRERAADIGGVAGQVLDALSGRRADNVSGLKEVVLWAHEVTPAQLGRWKRGQLKAILTQAGGLTSHVAILAKAMEIPALMGYTPPPETASGAAVAVDANRPEVVINPAAETREDFITRREKWESELARDHADSQGEAVSRDGCRIPVMANIGDVATAATAAQNGAEGVGLLRTEFLFLDRGAPPTEEEQVAQLATLFKPFAGKPVVARTLDAGGDKAMPWLQMPPDPNPFLGVRGVRLVRQHPELLRTQLRALLRAGQGYDLQIMVPMIATLDEVDFVRNILDDCGRELTGEGAAHVWPVRFGIMVETPAAALQAEKLAAKVDFFSIGSNDLTQYVMCAERGSQALLSLSDSMHPAVLKAISLICAGAAAHGTEVAVCGEMAGDPVAARALLGLGVDHLSMNASAIGRVKRAIRNTDIGQLRTLAQKALTLDSAAAARGLFAEGG